MTEKTLFKHRPDYAVPPGETLQETLQAIGMSQAELAQRTGLSPKHINRIVRGIEPITPETAISLEKVLSVPASLWNGLEKNFREQLARIEDLRELKPQTGWLRQFPIKELVQSGWVKKGETETDQIKNLLEFFGVAGPEQWGKVWNSPEAAFRSSAAFKSKPGAVSAWLRQGEIKALKLECKAYDREKFLRSQEDIRKLTVETKPIEFEQQLKRICRECGVAVVFVPELPKTHLYGATRWVGGRPVIQLSLRYKTHDHLWFTFFHEAGHILFHGKKEAFLEEENMKDGKEEEADRYACNTLIPEDEYKAFVTMKDFSENTVLGFARAIGTAPGVVVGRLQHDKHIKFDRLNGLKVRYRLKENPKV